MSTGLVVAILIGCVALIGAIFVLYKRGGEAKPSDQPAATTARQ